MPPHRLKSLFLVKRGRGDKNFERLTEPVTALEIPFRASCLSVPVYNLSIWLLPHWEEWKDGLPLPSASLPPWPHTQGQCVLEIHGLGFCYSFLVCVYRKYRGEENKKKERGGEGGRASCLLHHASVCLLELLFLLHIATWPVFSMDSVSFFLCLLLLMFHNFHSRSLTYCFLSGFWSFKGHSHRQA